jgi:hypothetical protein
MMQSGMGMTESITGGPVGSGQPLRLLKREPLLVMLQFCWQPA